MLKISIEYCRVWNYTPRAVGLINELLEDKELEAQIESLMLIPTSGGKFEITVNGELVFSKKALGRHAEPGEVYGLVKANVGWVRTTVQPQSRYAHETPCSTEAKIS